MLGPLFVVAAALVLLIASAGAANQGGFEIDAGAAQPNGALYSGVGTSPAGDDWTKGATGNGVFKAHVGAGTGNATPGGAGCYGSQIDKGDAAGTKAFICDGNSDSKFKAFPEQNVVSPSGKTQDASWPIKPGNVRPKNDFSHAYVYTKLADSPCTAGSGATDTMLYLGGHVGDNEGDHFWGFEFDKNPPTNFDQLVANSGASFTLGFNRSIGDILVSFTVPGNASDPVVIEVFRVTGFNADGSAIVTLAAAQPGCPPAQPQGLTELATNTSNDVTAPPWNVPVCDPTADNSANTCRLANGGTPAEDLLAPRDFAEASVDLAAFGINPCFSNIIFTSRSSHVLTGADVQDVGGANFPLCGAKSGTKFKDTNANGTKDAGEPALGGWTMKLYTDLNHNQTLDAADDSDGNAANGITPSASQTTDATGAYSFPSLGQGDFIVCEVNQATWFESRPFSGMSGLPAGESVTNSCPTGNISGAGGYTLATNGYAFHMTGADLPGNDFGNFQQGTKSGVKFNDLNGDGTKDAGEPGLNNWVIRAYADTNGDGTLQATETTIAASDTTHTAGLVDGAYLLTLNPGKYVVCEVLQATWIQSRPSGNTKCSAISGLAASGYALTITSGSTEPNNDFGNFQQGTKSGVKFNDLNANGTKDAGEPGLNNWVIRAYADTNGDGTLQATETTIAASDTTHTAGWWTVRTC